MREIKIFLSSPSDVKDDRDQIEQLIREFGAETEQERQVKLIPLVWEKDMPKGPGNPQEKANQLVNDSQIYIGFLGARFGSPTGKAESGTYEEFLYAYHRWERKEPIDMRLFFKKVQVDVSELSKEDNEQIMKVIDFRNLIKSNFTFDEYKKVSELKIKVKKELQEIIRKLPPKPSINETRLGAIISRLAMGQANDDDITYLKKIIRMTENRSLVQVGEYNIYIENAQGDIHIGPQIYRGVEAENLRSTLRTIVPAEISEEDVLQEYQRHLNRKYTRIQIFEDKYFDYDKIYITLKLEKDPLFIKGMSDLTIESKARDGKLTRNKLIAIGYEDQGERSRDSCKNWEIKDVVSKTKQALILGDAGTGKTTLFKRLVWENKEFAGAIPVYLAVKNWAAGGFGDPLISFVQSINEESKLINPEYLPGLQKWLTSLWLQDRVLLLLDGLDEIGQAEFERACRALNELSLGQNLVLVSCRMESYQRILDRDKWWAFRINSFTKDDRRQFIGKYFHPDTSKAAALIGLVENRDELRNLGEIPLLLGLICFIYEPEQELPRRKNDLYQNCVLELLGEKRRQQQKYGKQQEFKKLYLQRLAYDFFKQADEKQRLCISKDRMRETFIEELEKSPMQAGNLRPEDFAEFIREITEKNGLLSILGVERYCFPHRSFQEYFAAGYLEKQGKHGFEEIVNDLSGDDFWTNTICFYAGMIPDATALINRLGKEQNLDLVLRIIPEAYMINWGELDKEALSWKIRRGAVEKQVAAEIKPGKEGAVVGILKGILEHDPNGNVRYSALIGLEKIGTAVGLEIVKNTYIISPELIENQQAGKFYQARGKEFEIIQPENMVLVPGGSLVMSETKEPVKDFLVSIFPVTNGEYRRFVEAGGYKNKGYWTEDGLKAKKDMKWDKPGYWGDPRFSHDWQPVVGVSFWEAEAYCEWLTEFYNKKHNKEYKFRLPTEEEWERAALGPGGDEYAFLGKEKDSWDEDKPRWDSHYEYEKGLTYGPSRVNTVYKESVSGFGLFDMSGNVWEWTSSLYEKGGSCRVIRGGGWWSNYPAFLRSADRGRIDPASRSVNVGFRLVRLSALKGPCSS